jgi:hypothetical protein
MHIMSCSGRRTASDATAWSAVAVSVTTIRKRALDALDYRASPNGC